MVLYRIYVKGKKILMPSLLLMALSPFPSRLLFQKSKCFVHHSLGESTSSLFEIQNGLTFLPIVLHCPTFILSVSSPLEKIRTFTRSSPSSLHYSLWSLLHSGLNMRHSSIQEPLHLLIQMRTFDF